jgi:Tfp pilus assembly protein PilV
MQCHTRSSQSAHRAREGFTLIDVLCALMLVGVGIAAMMHFYANSTVINVASGRMAAATVLANGLYEYAASLNPGLPPAGTSAPVTHVLQLNGSTFSPPIDGHGDAISGMDEWSQTVTVVSVPRWAIAGEPVAATPTNLRRLEVAVSHGGKAILSTRWILAPSMPAP